MAKSLKQFPSVSKLKQRYATACDLKQTVDKKKIKNALLNWCAKIGAPKETKIIFISSAEEIKKVARDARDARAAGAAGAAWAAWAARAAGAAGAAGAAWVAWAARDARAARVARDAWVAWVAGAAWDASWLSIAAIGAVELKDETQARIWLPIFEAFEAGAFVFFVIDAEIFVSTIPVKIATDDQRRPHCADGPAFVWLDDVREYYWHGVFVPPHWIEKRAELEPTEILKASDVEQRAAGAAIIGWPKMVTKLKRKIIDGVPDSDLGALIELTLPGLPEPGRFLQAKCPRNGMIVEGVPRVSDIDNLPIETVIAAQAWRVGDPQSEYQRPSIRT